MWEVKGHLIIETRSTRPASFREPGSSRFTHEWGFPIMNKAYAAPFKERGESAKQHPNLCTRPREQRPQRHQLLRFRLIVLSTLGHSTLPQLIDCC